MFKLIGQVVPYGVPTASPCEHPDFREVVAKGAFSQATLSEGAANGAHFRIDHDRTRAIPTSQIRYVSTWAGLYALIDLPDSPKARELMRLKSRWKGMSITFDRSTLREHLDASTQTCVIASCGFICGFAVCVDGTPAYRSTWLAEQGPAATARIKAENDAVVSHRWRGLNYRTAVPKAWWTLPLQGPEHEARLAQHDPDRGFMVSVGAIEL